ncbi:hypothetical protein JNB62_13145 [Microbacterium jejuense]|uniref:Transcriptional regulator n=1 Tax=Microbacterium jejuense TaxID=1263637 RepID=A0ABS7HNV3_9MICO|nr:hypothetical protein [Microbacterium jejuense]MBW9094636.1 hypothetical protein [Microbacterium jejuense]
MAESKKPADKEFAGNQRKEYLDGLKVELAGYKRYGNKEREADVLAEIKRVTGGRGNAQSAKAPTSNAASTPPAQA